MRLLWGVRSAVYSVSLFFTLALLLTVLMATENTEIALKKSAVGVQGQNSNETQEEYVCEDSKEYADYCKTYRKNKFCIKYEYGMRKYCALTCGYCKCKAKVDIVFMIDGSGSIEKQGAGNFQKCLNFVKEAINATWISPEFAHVGVVLFSSQVQLIFGLEQFFDHTEMLDAVDKIKYPRGSSRTGLALKFVKEKVFDVAKRKDAARILIVMTDGKSNGRPTVSTPAKALKDSGVSIFAIGIGDFILDEELADIASDPDDAFVQETTFDELPSVFTEIRDDICRVKNSTAMAISGAQVDEAEMGVFKSNLQQNYNSYQRYNDELYYDGNENHYSNKHHFDL